MILFSKPAGDGTPSGVDRAVRAAQVGHNQGAGQAHDCRPAPDLSLLRPEAPTDPPSVCVAATNPSPGAAGGVGATAGAGSPNSSGESGLSLDRVVRSSGPGSPLPRFVRHWCHDCNARERSFINGRCSMEHTH